MHQAGYELKHHPDSDLGAEIEVVVRMKREQRIFLELHINR
jgi:hypothetical protein